MWKRLLQKTIVHNFNSLVDREEYKKSEKKKIVDSSQTFKMWLKKADFRNKFVIYVKSLIVTFWFLLLL